MASSLKWDNGHTSAKRANAEGGKLGRVLSRTRTKVWNMQLELHRTLRRGYIVEREKRTVRTVDAPRNSHPQRQLVPAHHDYAKVQKVHHLQNFQDASSPLANVGSQAHEMMDVWILC
jgi:hypothetical protein